MLLTINNNESLVSSGSWASFLWLCWLGFRKGIPYLWILLKKCACRTDELSSCIMNLFLSIFIFRYFLSDSKELQNQRDLLRHSGLNCRYFDCFFMVPPDYKDVEPGSYFIAYMLKVKLSHTHKYKYTCSIGLTCFCISFIQPTQQQVRSRRSAYASTETDGITIFSLPA